MRCGLCISNWWIGYGTTRLVDGLMQIPGCILNSPNKQSTNGALHIINFSLPDCTALEIMLALDNYHIYVSKSSACSSRSNKPSRVLLAAGIAEEVANRAIRVSFSAHNSIDEVDKFLLTLHKIVVKMKIRHLQEETKIDTFV